ncbi:uncharacterized protein [Arachis hypogaea]|uniref:uncharacterized protein n=1 Tax=Arachis hypogaea TaxID=3818 RepID=UPI000DEC2E5A|nr:uncharacterized protein LOC112805798 [Arachis hypogaea]
MKVHANTLVFRDLDSFGEFYHNKPLYVEAVVEGMKVRRALVDAGSGVNIIPTHIFLEMRGSADQIRPTQVELNAFNGVGVKSRGCVNAVLEVGPIKTNNKFHVVDGSSSYHILLGRPWIHLHRCVPSSWHQCIKSSWRKKDISISATITPFDAGEAHLMDASFYEQLPLPGVNKIRPVQEYTIGTPRQKAVQKNTLMEEAPKENTKKRATAIEDLGLRKEILPGGGYRCIENAPFQLQDEAKQKEEELEEINLGTEEHPRPLFVCKTLGEKEKRDLIALLTEFRDVFAWNYDKMPGLDPNLVTHNLAVRKGATPVKQAPRKFSNEIEAQVKKEIKKLLAAKFVKPIQHPSWLAIVPVKKKNGQIRCCVDFRDLNKACPKDDFSLPDVDRMVDVTAGFERFSFMDRFSGYNQIRMAPGDKVKTAFRTPVGNFYYTVMPFGLKNAGATYQRAMTAIFHDIMHDFVEDYVDDLVVKSTSGKQHTKHLRAVFTRCRKYRLKMNPMKYAFGVSSGKFLGFRVHKGGISADEDKIKAIQDMESPKDIKGLQKFIGKLGYIRRFIPALGELLGPLRPLLKEKNTFTWGQHHQAVIDKIKNVLTSTHTMTSPQLGAPLKVYLAVGEEAVSGLIAQEGEGKEKPIAYVSKAMKGPEQRYSSPEKHCLALVEYDVKLVTPTTIKSQDLADLLSIYPKKATIEELPDQISRTIETVYACNEEETWTLMFDGAPSNPQGGARVVLIDSHGRNLSFIFRLDFSCTNNEAEYEALMLDLKMAQEVGIKKLHVKGDSNIIIQQILGGYGTKERSLALCREQVWRMMKVFDKISFEHVPRTENKHADALPTLGSRVTIQNGQHALEHRVAESPAREEGMSVEGKINDWRTPLHEQLRTLNITKETRGFCLLNGQMFRKSNDGLLMKCVGEEERKEKAEQLHGATCGEEGPGLYRRLQRWGIYWPKMKFHCDELQASCKACQETKESMQICNVHN